MHIFTNTLSDELHWNIHNFFIFYFKYSCIISPGDGRVPVGALTGHEHWFPQEKGAASLSHPISTQHTASLLIFGHFLTIIPQPCIPN